jgi:hypothetical protein
MADWRRHTDPWSLVVVVVTLALFVAALFLKGLTHDLLLEAGVFLVSVKLIMMAYKQAVASDRLGNELTEIRAALQRLEKLTRKDPGPPQ